MHSRIFQISKEPITKDNYAHTSRYEDGFVGRIADYVVESDSKASDISWLTTCHEGLKVEGNTLTIISKEEYFEKSFTEFKNLLEELKDYTITDFIDRKNWMKFYNLKASYNEEYGFYIDDNDEYFGIATLDEFMRNVEDGDVYYIGCIFDYHF